MPDENPNYNKDISCFVIYPGTNNLTNLQTDLENIRDWFTKFVVVVPDQSNVNWLALKDQIETHVAQVDYNVIDYSIGLYGDSTDIIDDLPSINPRNLVLFNPKLNDTISSSIKPLSGKKYFIYEKTKDKTLTKYITNIKSVSTSSYEMATASTAPINDFKSKLKAEVEKNLIKPSLKTLDDEVRQFTNKYDNTKNQLKIKLLLEDMSDGNATPYDTDIIKVLYAGDQLKIKVSLDDTERRTAEYQDSLKEDNDIYDYFQMDQYQENLYSGQEEEYIPIADPIQSPVDDVSTNNNVVDSSSQSGNYEINYSIGKGLPSGSKLLVGSKYGKFIADARNGLAGHRLRPFMNDLSNYLKSRGFGTVGDLGVTRELYQATYPSNSKRVGGSFHGAGLAIDTTWWGINKSWTGIGSNSIVASNKELVIAVWEFVKKQGDILWGAQWGKSDPSKGLIQGWGVTEFHHFQIKYDHVAKYWEPFKNDLNAMGFDYRQLRDCADFQKLYKRLLEGNS